MKKSTEGWLVYAKSDLRAAKTLIENCDELNNIIVFHCQQCCEKCLKAIMENADIRIPKVHSLERLYAEIATALQADIDFDEEFLNFMDDIYISARYPSDLGLLPTGMPTKEETLRILSKTESLYHSTLKVIN